MARKDPLITALYRDNYDKLYRVAYRLTGSGEEAMDLVQDAFVLALFRREALSAHPNPEGWLMVTLSNLVKNQRRRLSRQELPLELFEGLPAAQEGREIDELLPARLSPADRDILLWRFKEQADYRQIADRLGVSETGCRSRVCRAVARCRELLEKEGGT